LIKVETALGKVLLPDLTEDRIRKYMGARQSEGAGGRTVNMEEWRCWPRWQDMDTALAGGQAQ
jgi:hypothetical protein